MTDRFQNVARRAGLRTAGLLLLMPSVIMATAALAQALEKIHHYGQGLPFATAEAHPATAQMMIINPLTAGGMAQLFSTHPPLAERVARLREMARAAPGRV